MNPLHRLVAALAAGCLLTLTGHASAAPTPLTEKELGAMVAAGMPDAEIAAELRTRKIASGAPAELIQRLKNRGAGPGVLAAAADPANLAAGAPALSQPPPPPPRSKPEILTPAQARALGNAAGGRGGSGTAALPARIPLFRALTDLRAGWTTVSRKLERDSYVEFYARTGGAKGDLQRLAVGTVLSSPGHSGPGLMPSVTSLVGKDWDLEEVSRTDTESILLMRPRQGLDRGAESKVGLLRQRIEGEFLMFVILLSREETVTRFEQDKWLRLVKSFGVTPFDTATAAPSGTP